MMKKTKIEIIQDPVKEARRYVENAEEILQKRGWLDKDTNCYDDRKYVKAAGHYLWNAVLIMLDAVFNVKSRKHPHPDVNDYQYAVAQRDRKLLTLVNTAYETTHIIMGYDGTPSKAICDEGFRLANDIIDRCAAMLTPR